MKTFRLRRALHVLNPLKTIKVNTVDRPQYYSVVDSSSSHTARVRVLKKEEHGLRDSLISPSSWRVLHRLKDAGHKSYLVGGSVRDLLVKQTPKDFDILTTAEPKQVKQSFPGRCIIVGRRFPVCHVTSMNMVIEVSSFSTSLQKDKENKVVDGALKGPEGWDCHDVARWDNCLKRDFTVNGLMYDPFQRIVYDYVGGLKDLRKSKIRTVIPAEKSFREDPARILRAIRIAARLEFSLTTSTATAIRELKSSILGLNKTRLQLEVNTMMAHGASERSVRLQWRYGLLEYLLPLQAKYLQSINFKRQGKVSNLLLDFLKNLDRVTAPDRPCHGGLWLSVLAFHMALNEVPRKPMVVSAVAVALSLGTGLQKAVAHMRQCCEYADKNGPSLWNELGPTVVEMDDARFLEECQLLVLAAIHNVSLLSSPVVTVAAVCELTGESAPSDWVVISRPYYYMANRLFSSALVGELEDSLPTNDEVKDTSEKVHNPAQSAQRSTGGYIGHVFSHVVLSTLFPSVYKKQ